MAKHFQILIIGGGTGGIMTAAQLKNKRPDLSIAIIEPSENHYYQPAFTLVGAGTYNMKNTLRQEASLIPSGVEWVKDKATALRSEDNKVETEKSGSIGYDYLIVAPGLVYDLSLIDGLEEALAKGVVCSNYI